MTQMGFYHNPDICIGCRTCIIACKDKYNLPLGEKFRRVYDYGGGSWEIDSDGVCSQKDVFVYSVSVSCMHCIEPACLAACPVEAIAKREDGVVTIDPETCIGCGSCATACPFGAPYVSAATGIARKCDLCRDYIDKGEPPACVASCSMRCLNYGDIDQLKVTYGDVQNVAPLPENAGTGPSIVFTPSRLNPDGSLPGQVLNAPEELESATV